jgi:CP family cyanate transporter-like MFS transporter
MGMFALAGPWLQGCRRISRAPTRKALIPVAAIPALIAFTLWVLCAGDQRAQVHTVGLPIRNIRAWVLMAFFGIGTGAYTLVLAWLPPYYIELG